MVERHHEVDDEQSRQPVAVGVLIRGGGGLREGDFMGDVFGL